jgi:hypothetical protein
VFIGVMLTGFVCMMASVEHVTVSSVGVVTAFFVVTAVMMFGGLAVMACCMVMMLGGLCMVRCTLMLVSHGLPHVFVLLPGPWGAEDWPFGGIDRTRRCDLTHRP